MKLTDFPDIALSFSRNRWLTYVSPAGLASAHVVVLLDATSQQPCFLISKEVFGAKKDAAYSEMRFYDEDGNLPPMNEVPVEKFLADIEEIHGRLPISRPLFKCKADSLDFEYDPEQDVTPQFLTKIADVLTSFPITVVECQDGHDLRVGNFRLLYKDGTTIITYQDQCLFSVEYAPTHDVLAHFVWLAKYGRPLIQSIPMDKWWK